MSESLHGFLTDKQDYTKSYEDFTSQFSSQDSQKLLFDFMKKKKY